MHLEWRGNTVGCSLALQRQQLIIGISGGKVLGYPEDAYPGRGWEQGIAMRLPIKENVLKEITCWRQVETDPPVHQSREVPPDLARS